MKNKYEHYDELYEALPNSGKMSSSKDRVVNTNMATLKRVEGARNRYIKQGLLK
jgi:hypothetical protein